MSKPKSLFGKSFKVFMLLAILASVIYLIVRNIDAFGNVLLVLVGFGAGAGGLWGCDSRSRVRAFHLGQDVRDKG